MVNSMTHSVTDIVCNKCTFKFFGVLNGVFNISKEYVVVCPSCSEEIFFNPGIAIMDSDIPGGAVNVRCASDIKT